MLNFESHFLFADYEYDYNYDDYYTNSGNDEAATATTTKTTTTTTSTISAKVDEKRNVANLGLTTEESNGSSGSSDNLDPKRRQKRGSGLDR